MTDAGIGRILVASLHQAIADLLPTRLEFYENWLNPDGLRNGRIGLAPLAAVLSFLRREGDAYQLIVARAGEYSAEWTFGSLPRLKRAVLRVTPRRLRTRAAVRRCRRLINETYRGSRALVRFRHGRGRVDLRGSLFCGVRQPVTEPLCGFYAAAIARVLALHGIPAEARISSCRAVGEPGCHIVFAVTRLQEAERVAAPERAPEQASGTGA